MSGPIQDISQTRTPLSAPLLRSLPAVLLSWRSRTGRKNCTWIVVPFLVLLLGVVDLPLFGQTPPSSVRWYFNVPVPMRDGVKLAADVYLPRQTGRYPVLLERTPYGKGGSQKRGICFARHGYAVVIEDTRGRYDSGGKWYPFIHEANDGQDTIAWTARQPWSNGKVVTIGASYNGIDQWLAAARNNPALAGMIVGFAPSDLYGNTVSMGGAFKLKLLKYAVAMGDHVLSADMGLISWHKLIWSLPVESIAPRWLSA